MRHVVQRSAARVRGSDERTDAGAGNEVDGNFGSLEGTQHAYMGDAAGESAAERDTDFGPQATARVSKGTQAANRFTEPAR